MKSHLICLADSRNPILLNHFINWYKNKVSDFHLVLHVAPNFDPAESLEVLKKQNIDSKIWIGEYTTFELRRIRDEIRKSLPKNEWKIMTDCDEFQNWNPILELEKFDNSYNLVPGIMIDMIGKTFKVMDDSSLFEQYPERCFITQTIGKSWISKIVAMRGNTEPYGKGGGYCYANPDYQTKVIPKIIEIFHFKWDSTTLERMKRRSDTNKKIGLEWNNLTENLIEFLSVENELNLESHKTPNFDPVDPRMLKSQFGEMYNGESLDKIWSSYR